MADPAQRPARPTPGDLSRLELADLLDAPTIQALMDDLHRVTHFGMAILDLSGRVLVGTGWQEICTRFHRVHPETRRCCEESDLELTRGVAPGTFKAYRCKNNLWDIVTPIVVGGAHLGNLFLGQFLFEDETPDHDDFRARARRCGFDEAEYLAALEKVPRWSRASVEAMMSFYARFSGILAGSTHANLRLGRSLAEREELYSSLERSEAQYRRIVTTAREGIFVLDADHRFTFLNDRMAELFGSTQPQVLGTPAELWVAPEEREALRAALSGRRDLEGGAREWRLQRADGETLSALVSASPILEPDGRFRGALGLVTDISARKRAEDEVRWNLEVSGALAALYRPLAAQRSGLREISLAVLEQSRRLTESPHGFVSEIDPVSGDSVGHTLTEMMERCQVTGTSRRIAFPRSPDGSYRGLWGQALTARRPFVCNAPAAHPARVGTPAGHLPLERLLSVPVLLGGELVGQIAVANAPREYGTGEVQALERIAEFYALAIQRERAEAARERLQEQLFQAQKLESIGTLAGGLAHDFNNLLGGLLTGLSLIELELPDRAELRQDLATMKGLVERGAALTHQLLGFSRRGKYEARLLELGRVVEETVRMFQRMRKDLVIQVACAPGLPPVLADRTQLEQVLLNLLLNAGQAMPDGGEVRVRTEETVVAAGTAPGAAGRYLKLSVADRGVGMDPETRARVFEPFFTTKEPGRGTGLGLASVYGIVTNHGGFVSVESEPGAGATFSVFLPAAEGARATITPPQPVPAVAAHGETILVVDDEEQILRLCGRLLRSLGYQVLTAQDGLEAQALLERHRDQVALVILDLVMPGLSGEQTFEALRRIFPEVKVLLSSGYSEEGQAAALLARGCSGFIQKPFGAGALSAKLRELL